MKCFACGADKDENVKALYPYSGEFDCITTEKPIRPLFATECQGEQDRPDGSWDFRMAVMCHDCFHRLCENTQGVDMWIGQKCWESLHPLVPFEQLPLVRNDLAKNGDRGYWNPTNYEPQTTGWTT